MTLKRKILYSHAFRRLMRWSKRVVLPGFGGFDLFQISRFFFDALAEGQIVMRASAIAFKLFVAFFPALIVLLTLIPYVPVQDFQEKLLSAFNEMMPVEVYKFIESTLHDLVVRKHGALLSVSFLIGLYVASNSINAILMGFSGSANHTKWHSPLRQRLLSLGLLVALTLLTVISIPLLTFSGTAIRWLNESGYLNTGIQLIVLFIIKWLFSVLIVMISVSLLYSAGDPHAKRFKLITPGALLAVFLILIISQVLAYMFGHVTNYNALYGSIGAILAVQLWFYLNMVAILIGYELNTSITKAHLEHRSKLAVSMEAAS
ncbi:MAG TPA: YihY/virulence factor BrkB family protein [Flavobacteriales bacterium]|nr:YihY/virulence factor BrkB family protein [Flavobacteriales bacterium]